MARHNEILTQFKEITPTFNFNNKSHTNLLSMILIKVADISNEARPMDVAEPWLDRLLQEFFKQSDAEKLEGLPVTPFMDREKITKPSSQCSFIGFVLLPLFEALGDLFPELQSFIVQPVRDALDHYRRLNEAAKDERLHRKSLAEMGEGETSAVVKSASAHSMKSRRSLGGHSKSAEEDDVANVPTTLSLDEPVLPIQEEATVHNVEDDEQEDEDDEDDEGEDEEETVTEVEVSEKTLKFKISTESSVTTPGGRKSYPGSRKGSRERPEVHDTPEHPSPDKHISHSVPVSPGDLCNGVQGKKTTLMARLRTLTDRLSFGSDKHEEESGSPNRAMTLPKARKPQRKTGVSAKRGWKLLSPTESSSPDMRLQNTRCSRLGPTSSCLPLTFAPFTDRKSHSQLMSDLEDFDHVFDENNRSGFITENSGSSVIGRHKRKCVPLADENNRSGFIAENSGM
ncbi:hypothetical protein L9F63_010355, partial [Diploptera punctata]